MSHPAFRNDRGDDPGPSRVCSFLSAPSAFLPSSRSLLLSRSSHSSPIPKPLRTRSSSPRASCRNCEGEAVAVAVAAAWRQAQTSAIARPRANLALTRSCAVACVRSLARRATSLPSVERDRVARPLPPPPAALWLPRAPGRLSPCVHSTAQRCTRPASCEPAEAKTQQRSTHAHTPSAHRPKPGTHTCLKLSRSTHAAQNA